MKQFAVYILASKRRGTLYTGVTSDLVSRIVQHKEHQFRDSFTERYGVTQLVWFEQHETADSAILREKRIKEWKRAWKVELIEGMNPHWDDLFDQIVP